MSTGDPLAQSPAHVNGLSNYQAALWYHKRGLFPIPWIARNGKKLVAFEGFKYDEYTADQRAVNWVLDQWAFRGEWQVGLALHENVGVFAVDVDSPDQLAAWEAQHGPIQGNTWTQTTGRAGGGEHRLFRLEGRGAVWPKQGGFDRKHPNLEYRSNGFIGVSPSIHPSGMKYQWRDDSPVEIAATGWEMVSAIASRAAMKERGHASTSGSTRAAVQADGTVAYACDIDDLLVGGVPAGQSQHAVLRDFVWDCASRGMSDIMIKTFWDQIVALTPLSRPDQPWTDADFERLLAGAREKIGGGIEPELMRWAVAVHNTPIETAEVSVESTPEPEQVSASEPKGTSQESNPLRPLSYGELKAYGAHQAGMGKLFVDRFGDCIRWCNDENAYYTWFPFKGEKVTCWQREAYTSVSPRFMNMVVQLGEVVRACVNMYTSTVDESSADGRQQVKDARLYMVPFQKAETIRGVTKIAIADQRIAATPDDFTPKPYILNFINGTYNVKTGEMHPHRREDMNIATIPRTLDMSLAEKDLGIGAPKFDSMLWRMCAAEDEVDSTTHALRVQAVQRWLGYQLHGSNPEKKLGVFEGATSIGKSQVVEIVGELLNDYAYTSCPPSLLVRSRQDRHSSVEAGLSGKRLVIVNELTKGQVLDEGQVLRLVNPEGTRVDLRKMRENAVSTEITWKLTVTTNEMPRTDTTEQILQRLAFYPLSKVQIPKDQRDPSMKANILKDEADVILAHAVSWWREWWMETERGNRNALALPQESTTTLNEFVEDNLTPLHEFVDELCEIGNGGYVDARDVWRRATGYWQDQHPDKRLEYSGGKKELFKILGETEGVERVTRGNRKILVGFKNVQVRDLYGKSDHVPSEWVTAVKG